MKKNRKLNTQNHTGNVAQEEEQECTVDHPNIPVRSGVVQNPDAQKAEHWAGLINERLQRSVAQLVEAGRVLLAAKKQLLHGEWQGMFRDGLVHMHIREAERLMDIARNPAFSNANSYSFLPPSIQALSALGKADPKALELGIARKEITPCTTVKEAKAFHSAYPASPIPTKEARAEVFDMDRSLKRIDAVLWTQLDKCPNCNLADFVHEIRVILERMEEAVVETAGESEPQEPTSACPGSFEELSSTN